MREYKIVTDTSHKMAISDNAVMEFLREYGPLSPSKKKDTATGRILAASAASLAEELLDRIGRKRKLTEVG